MFEIVPKRTDPDKTLTIYSTWNRLNDAMAASPAPPGPNYAKRTAPITINIGPLALDDRCLSSIVVTY